MNPRHQSFLDTISGYDYFTPGTLDIEELCMLLALAFDIDQVSDPPEPVEIYDLLIGLASQASAAWGVSPPFRQDFPPGSHFDEAVHPGGQLTLLRPETALMIFDEFTVALGRLLGRLSENEVPQAGYWIDPEWTCVGTLMDGFYRSIGELMHRMEFSSRQALGYSGLEAIKLASMRPNLDPERLLEAHVEHVNLLTERAAYALDTRAFAEAVAFQEKVISFLLSNALELNGIAVRSALVSRIHDAQALDSKLRIDRASDLWDRMHAWRQRRNQVIHGEERSLFDLPSRLEDLDALAEDAARQGACLIQELKAWSIEARARALDIGLPRPKRELHRPKGD